MAMRIHALSQPGIASDEDKAEPSRHPCFRSPALPVVVLRK